MTAVALPDEYVRCRGLGHRWDDFAPIDMRAPLFGHRLSYRCDRCLTERHDLIARHSGDLLQREYRYPKDYAVSKDERPDAAELRARIADIRERRKRRKSQKAKKST